MYNLYILEQCWWGHFMPLQMLNRVMMTNRPPAAMRDLCQQLCSNWGSFRNFPPVSRTPKGVGLRGCFVLVTNLHHYITIPRLFGGLSVSCVSRYTIFIKQGGLDSRKFLESYTNTSNVYQPIYNLENVFAKIRCSTAKSAKMFISSLSHGKYPQPLLFESLSTLDVTMML